LEGFEYTKLTGFFTKNLAAVRTPAEAASV
jgi:hypothetical protein